MENSHHTGEKHWTINDAMIKLIDIDGNRSNAEISNANRGKQPLEKSRRSGLENSLINILL